jgi:hypothetical protein
MHGFQRRRTSTTWRLAVPWVHAKGTAKLLQIKYPSRITARQRKHSSERTRDADAFHPFYCKLIRMSDIGCHFSTIRSFRGRHVQNLALQGRIVPPEKPGQFLSGQFGLSTNLW